MATDPSSSSSSSTSRTRGLRKGRSTKDLLAAYKAELTVPTAPLPPLPQPDPRQTRPLISHNTLADLASEDKAKPDLGIRRGRSHGNLRSTARSQAQPMPTFDLSSLEAIRTARKDGKAGSELVSPSSSSIGCDTTSSFASWSMSMDRSEPMSRNTPSTSSSGTSRYSKFGDTASSNKTSRSRLRKEEPKLSSCHMRYAAQVPILPVLETPQLSARCEQIFLRIQKAASSIIMDDNIETDRNLVPSFRYAVPFSPYSPDYEAFRAEEQEPDSFILPKNVYKLRSDKAGWMEDLLRYPERPMRRAGDDVDAKRPDLFSRAHRIAARSNGTTMIVTMYLDPSPDSQPHVYITPGMAIDLSPLGSAAMDFERYFDHLLKPQRVWNAKSLAEEPRQTQVMEVHPAQEHREWQDGLVRHDETGLEGLFVDGQSVPLPKVDITAESTTGSRGDISEDELQLVTSKVARLAQAAISHPLEPKRRTTMWPATWHTHDPATVKFYDENPPDDDAERDAGYDMRYVTGLTGAIGVTFVFKLDPITRQISSTVHPSWQFSPFHRFRLMELNQLVHKAVQSSLLLSELVKRGIRATGLELPTRPEQELGWERDSSPVMSNLLFIRKSLGWRLPSSVGYPSKADRKREVDEVIKYFGCRTSSICPMATPNRPIRQEPMWQESESPCLASPSSIDSSPVQRPPRLGRAHVTPSGKVLNFARELRRLT